MSQTQTIDDITLPWNSCSKSAAQGSAHARKHSQAPVESTCNSAPLHESTMFLQHSIFFKSCNTLTARFSIQAERFPEFQAFACWQSLVSLGWRLGQYPGTLACATSGCCSLLGRCAPGAGIVVREEREPSVAHVSDHPRLYRCCRALSCQPCWPFQNSLIIRMTHLPEASTHAVSGQHKKIFEDASS